MYFLCIRPQIKKNMSVCLSVYKFLEPPLLAQQCFQSTPFGCLKIFGVPPLYLHPPPPFHIKCTFPYYYIFFCLFNYSLPEDMAFLRNLTKLYVYKNFIEELPEVRLFLIFVLLSTSL